MTTDDPAAVALLCEAGPAAPTGPGSANAGPRPLLNITITLPLEPTPMTTHQLTAAAHTDPDWHAGRAAALDAAAERVRGGMIATARTPTPRPTPTPPTTATAAAPSPALTPTRPAAPAVSPSTTPASTTLGGRVRHRRRQLGLTLAELAAAADLSKPYLSLIETDRTDSPASVAILARLTDMLGLPPGELVARAQLQRTPPAVRALLAGLLGRPVTHDQQDDQASGVAALRELLAAAGNDVEAVAGPAVVTDARRQRRTTGDGAGELAEVARVLAAAGRRLQRLADVTP